MKSPERDRLQLMSAELRAHLQPPTDLISARRSHVYLQEQPDGAYVVTKQSKRRHKSATFRAETSFYQLAQNCPELGSIVPRFVGVDVAEAILYLEATCDSKTAIEFLRTASRSGSVALFSALGKTVAALHMVPITNPASLIRSPVPVARMLYPSPERLREITRGQLEYLRLAQGSAGVSANVAHIERTWRPICLTHGDLRLANVLFDLGGHATLIDWETWGVGNPCWDLAAVLADQLWISVADASNATTVGTDDLLRKKVLVNYAGNQAFWRSYIASLADSADPEAYWLDVGRYVSMRLFQLGYESLSNEDRLQRDSVDCLQLAENFAQAPGNHCLAFLGISRPLSSFGSAVWAT